MKRVHVAAAVIRGADGRVLIAKRPQDKHQGGLWEFPGGKVEEGEAVERALARELEEELGIRVEAARPLIQVQHDYPDKQVLLDVWEVSSFTGEPHGFRPPGDGQRCRVPCAISGFRPRRYGDACGRRDRERASSGCRAPRRACPENQPGNRVDFPASERISGLFRCSITKEILE